MYLSEFQARIDELREMHGISEDPIIDFYKPEDVLLRDRSNCSFWDVKDGRVVLKISFKDTKWEGFFFLRYLGQVRYLLKSLF